MAWQISKAGSRPGVLKSISEAQSVPAGDKQLEHAKAFIRAEIESLPAKFNGVRVHAVGRSENGRSAQIDIIPMELEL